MQSHLSENPEEIGRVKELRPEAEFYGDAYDRSGLFGGDCRTIMAHCVYSTEKEIKRMREKGRISGPLSGVQYESGIRNRAGPVVSGPGNARGTGEVMWLPVLR